MPRRREPDLIPAIPTAAVGDEEVAALARRYRRESIATLISVSRNERAPASARAQAAAKLLEYSDGRPGQARRITVADLPSMTDEQRKDLLSALLFQWEVELPGEFRRMLKEVTDEAVDQLMRQQAAIPQPDRYRTDPPRLQQEPDPTPPRPLIRRPGAAPPEPDAVTHEVTQPAEEPAPLPDNVVPITTPLPRGCHPVINPPPAGLVNDTAAAPSGGVHPDVLRRSALPPHLALDSAFSGYSYGYPWRFDR